ncbi:MAG: hypothetical protein AMJ65_16425 [Phycisphaerae bacterium SG8_4]|nr:MAG: hypothetical protein AMJ65_16425 [Phycisphaerae bacterium SG8_4]
MAILDIAKGAAGAVPGGGAIAGTVLELAGLIFSGFWASKGVAGAYRRVKNSPAGSILGPKSG